MEKTYSPTETVAFSECPLRYWFRQQQYTPRILSYGVMAAGVGRGFAKGIELYFREVPLGQCITAAQQTTDAFYAAHFAAGVESQEDTAENILKAPLRLEKALTKFDKLHPFRAPEWRNFRTEVPFIGYGSGTADIIAERGSSLTIIDVKTKILRPSAFKLQQFLLSFEHSWQLYHYVSAARAQGIAIASIGVCLVSFEPFSIDYEEWSVDDMFLTKWTTAASYYWTLMGVANRIHAYPNAPTHSPGGFLCEYYAACMGDTPYTDYLVKVEVDNRWNAQR